MEDKITGKMILYNQFSKELDGLYHLYARKSGLSDTAFWILYSVEESQSVYTQKELCEDWSYSRQTVNSALKKLVEQEIIELRPLPGNRKNKQIVFDCLWQSPCGRDYFAADRSREKQLSQVRRRRRRRIPETDQKPFGIISQRN